MNNITYGTIGLGPALVILAQSRLFATLRAQYNQIMLKEWSHARDFLILHSRATTRTDTPMWRACQTMVCPDSLMNRLELWREGGRLPPLQPELFGPSSWVSVLIGQNVTLQGWDPLADARQDRVAYQDRLSGIARLIAQTAPQFPNHREWLDRTVRSLRN
ncbi:MAG: tryptophan 7-halogenase [Hyphomonadaceae bacterium]|nr:tryptophan 7-halogenase [Hyphomonadaceae bacterium]